MESYVASYFLNISLSDSRDAISCIINMKLLAMPTKGIQTVSPRVSTVHQTSLVNQI